MNCRWMSFTCLLLYSPPSPSSMSVVFDFNDSLNDFAPVSLILLSVDVKIKEKKKNSLMKVFYVHFFLFLLLIR